MTSHFKMAIFFTIERGTYHMASSELFKTPFRLDFNEANIIAETSIRAVDRASFMRKLTALEEHTSDPYLVSCIKGLFDKLTMLEDEEFTRLLQDAKDRYVLFPANYQLPKTSEISL